MRNTRIFLALLIAIGISSCLAQKPRSEINSPWLLNTQWGGTAPLNQFTPNDYPLGCHAVAFAQILYFHCLSSHGQSHYTCTNGIEISETYSHSTPNWDRFALTKKNSRFRWRARRETASYLYEVASIIRKDFGRDQYVDYGGDFHKVAIESHFDCSVTAYSRQITTSLRDALSQQPSFHEILRTEVKSGRPVGLYYTNQKGGGHAIVIDGHVQQNGKDYFHANFGWFGRSDGWYLLEDLPPDTKEVDLILIVPKLSREKRG